MKMNWINCKEAARLISEGMDHPLPIHKHILIKFHLKICKGCVFFAQQLKDLRNLFTKNNTTPFDTDTLPPYTASLPDDVRKNIKKLLKENN